ncbi:MAG TPA: ATP-binding protein [Deltaproteobacteria bacterium]|nr:ATP-binding protein [Deltaproteobacteria bacterium]
MVVSQIGDELINREITSRTYDYMRDCMRQIHTRAECIIYNLCFLKNSQDFTNISTHTPRQKSKAIDGNTKDHAHVSSGNTGDLQSELTELRAEIHKAIGDSLTAIREIYNVAELIEVISSDPYKKCLVDISELVKSALFLLKRKMPPGTTVKGDLPNGGMTIRCYPFFLKHAVIELLLNSFTAISNYQLNAGDSGPIICFSVETKAEEHFIRLNISDNGSGISNETKEHIFEPYFSLWGRKGLGLTIVKWVIEKKHRGSISILSKKGKGTVVQISIPVP